MCCVCDPSVCLGVPSICQMGVISEFEFCALMLFLCSILCLMYSVSSLHVECILPFGMLCLAAWRMMFVKMIFVVFMSGGG